MQNVGNLSNTTAKKANSPPAANVTGISPKTQALRSQASAPPTCGKELQLESSSLKDAPKTDATRKLEFGFDDLPCVADQKFQAVSQVKTSKVSDARILSAKENCTDVDLDDGLVHMSVGKEEDQECLRPKKRVRKSKENACNEEVIDLSKSSISPQIAASFQDRYEARSLTASEISTMMELPLPPPLHRLHRIFQALNNVYNFLFTQRLQITWRRVKGVLQSVLPTEDICEKDIEVMAELSPKVIVIKEWVDNDQFHPLRGSLYYDESTAPMSNEQDFKIELRDAWRR